MDEVKRLLEGFADHAAEGLPAVDIDADVTRGRRALRRIKRRRRVTGVLCVAAASALVLAIGNQVRWWGNGSDVAGGTVEPETSATNRPAPSPGPSSAPPARPTAHQTISAFGAPVVELVANQRPWSTIACGLAPKGWLPEVPVAAGRVVLSQPEMRTADTAAKIVLQTSAQARTLTHARTTDAGGKTVGIGTVNGRLTAQVKLPNQWLLLELPTGTVEWPDDEVRRFLESCAVN